MAHFMVPRYVRIVPELPKTPTQKVQKNLLRDEGVTADTWDREAAGIRVRRERLSGYACPCHPDAQRRISPNDQTSGVSLVRRSCRCRLRSDDESETKERRCRTTRPCAI